MQTCILRPAQTVQRQSRPASGPAAALRDWIQECGVTTVVMESTGVYWIPLFQILEAAGLEVFAREEEKMKRKKLARLQNLAASLNYQLVPPS